MQSTSISTNSHQSSQDLSRKNPFKKRLSTFASVVVLAITLGTSYPTLANPIKEIEALIQERKLNEALERVNSYLENDTSNPKNAQIRFFKGLILTETNEVNEAIRVFTQLTNDYPDLPEPYNNLAVLHASQGDYEKARISLEMAIRTHPSYDTAYENLGDIYAKLASQSYDKALQIDGSNSAALTKLSMIQNIVDDPAGPSTITPTEAATPPARKPGPPAPVKPPPAPPAPAPVAEAPPELPPAPSKPKPTPAPNVPAWEFDGNNASNNQPTPPPAPSASNRAVVGGNGNTITLPSITSGGAPPSVSATTRAPSTRSNQTIGADKAVLAAVEEWADAWSKQDMSRYLNSYSNDFKPPFGMSRANWEKQRERRILGKDEIKVEVINPLITLTGDQAVVRFKQNYYSIRHTNVATKILTLQLEGNRWRIISERVQG